MEHQTQQTLLEELRSLISTPAQWGRGAGRALSLSPLHRWENWATERLSNLLSITSVKQTNTKSRGRICNQTAGSKIKELNTLHSSYSNPPPSWVPKNWLRFSTGTLGHDSHSSALRLRILATRQWDAVKVSRPLLVLGLLPGPPFPRLVQQSPSYVPIVRVTFWEERRTRWCWCSYFLVATGLSSSLGTLTPLQTAKISRAVHGESIPV